MKSAIVSFDWKTNFLVPVANLSKFLETINAYPRVESDYLNGETVTHFSTESEPQVVLISSEIVSEETYKQMVEDSRVEKEVP